MSNVELLERQVEQLSMEELAQFHDWFLEFEWQVWDRQIARFKGWKAGQMNPGSARRSCRGTNETTLNQVVLSRATI